MDRSELVATLGLVKPALASNNLIPVFQCFAFDGKTVSAYNDQIGLVAPCKVGKEPFAINGDILYGLLTNIQADDVAFEVEDDGVVMTADRHVSKLSYLPQDDFLFEEPKDKWLNTIELNADLIDGLLICQETASTDQAMPALVGIRLMHYGNGLALYSTDGDAITRYKLDNKASSAVALDVMLPTAFCEAVAKLWGALESPAGTLSISDKWAKAALKSGHVAYGTLLDKAEELDLEDMIKQHVKGTTGFVALPLGLKEALSRARVLSDTESQKTVLSVTKGKLRMLTETHMGTVDDEVTFRGHADIKKAYVNAAHIQRALAITDQMLVMNDSTAFIKGNKILTVVSNMG